MILVSYPISGINGQMINHPDTLLKVFDTTNKEESKELFIMLLCQFGDDNLGIYDMSSRLGSSHYGNIDTFVDAINHENIDFNDLWLINLNLEEEEVKEIMNGYKRDFVLVDGKNHKPTCFNERKDSMVVYGDFELALDDQNETDKLYGLLSVKNANGNYDVHIFSFKFDDVEEITTISTSNGDNDWFETSYDELCEVCAPSKKMYLLQTNYHEGKCFRNTINNRLFSYQAKAVKAFMRETNRVEQEFENVCGGWEQTFGYFYVQYDNLSDCCEIQLIEIESE